MSATSPHPQSQQTVPQWHRLLLPAALIEAAAGRRSARDWGVDAVMFLAAAGLGALVLGQTWGAHPGPTGALDALVGALGCLALWWRRRYPSALAVGVLVASTVSGAIAGATLVVLFNAAIRCAPRTVVRLVVLSAVTLVGYSLLYPSGQTLDWENLAVGGLITIVAIGWGLFVRAQRELLQSLRDEAARLQAEQESRSEQARDAERRRIAREMHDVLAHRLSLLSLHAGALEFRPDAPPEEVAAAASVIRSSAHAALTELRDVIGVLRDDGGGTAPPQPTLAQIPQLIEESREAGVKVRARIELPPGLEVSETLGRTAYRIVQEGLTNARKHAPSAAVGVELGVAEGALVVVVTTRAPVGVPSAVPSPAPPGAGTGLTGLTERVALAGGELTHGIDAGGDFVLRARLALRP